MKLSAFFLSAAALISFAAAVPRVPRVPSIRSDKTKKGSQNPKNKGGHKGYEYAASTATFIENVFTSTHICDQIVEPAFADYQTCLENDGASSALPAESSYCEALMEITAFDSNVAGDCGLDPEGSADGDFIVAIVILLFAKPVINSIAEIKTACSDSVKNQVVCKIGIQQLCQSGGYNLLHRYVCATTTPTTAPTHPPPPTASPTAAWFATPCHENTIGGDGDGYL